MALFAGGREPELRLLALPWPLLFAGLIGLVQVETPRPERLATAGFALAATAFWTVAAGAIVAALSPASLAGYAGWSAIAAVGTLWDLGLVLIGLGLPKAEGEPRWRALLVTMGLLGLVARLLPLTAPVVATVIGALWVRFGFQLRRRPGTGTPASGLRWWGGRAVAVTVMVIIVAMVAGVVYESRAQERDLEEHPPVGRLVEVDGHRFT